MKLIILDRDGVINYDSDDYVKSPQEWIPLPGSLEAIARLKQNGFTVAVVTNQSGISRGFYDESTLQAMHDKMRHLLADLGADVDLVLHCPHGPDDSCDCRKPLPGMFTEVARHFGLPLPFDNVYAVGDTWRDLQAAKTTGANPVLVKTGKGERTLKAHAAELDLWQTPVFENLADFVDYLLLNQ